MNVGCWAVYPVSKRKPVHPKAPSLIIKLPDIMEEGEEEEGERKGMSKEKAPPFSLKGQRWSQEERGER